MKAFAKFNFSTTFRDNYFSSYDQRFFVEVNSIVSSLFDWVGETPTIPALAHPLGSSLSLAVKGTGGVGSALGKLGGAQPLLRAFATLKRSHF